MRKLINSFLATLFLLSVCILVGCKNILDERPFETRGTYYYCEEDLNELGKMDDIYYQIGSDYYMVGFFVSKLFSDEDFVKIQDGYKFTKAEAFKGVTVKGTLDIKKKSGKLMYRDEEASYDYVVIVDDKEYPILVASRLSDFNSKL